MSLPKSDNGAQFSINLKEEAEDKDFISSQIVFQIPKLLKKVRLL